MNQDGQLQTLQDKLQEKAAQEQEVIMKVYEKNLEKLSKDLQKSSARELYTMKTATMAEIKKTSKHIKRQSRLLSWTFAKPLLLNLIIGFILSSGMTLGLYCTMGWRLDNVSEKIEHLNHTKKSLQKFGVKIQKLLNKTEGVYLYEDESGKYMVVPNGIDLSTYCEINSTPAIKIK